MTVPDSNLGVTSIGGTPVKIVSLCNADSTETTAPAVINGNVRERIMLADPSTGAPVDLLKSLNTTVLSGNYILTSADHMKDFACAGALTVTVPAGLSPRPTCTFDCPPTGNLSLVGSGGVTINGVSSTLTRARADNPAGVALRGHADADTYGLSGA